MSGDQTLTEVELRRLYLDEGLTEGEIASRFGTYQVRVNRLRKKWGIPTQVRTDRLDLPDELSLRLRSVLLGSMLGDGGLRPTGSQTASYVEHHSLKQKEYLDWKTQEWGPFFSSCFPSNKGVHQGFRLITHGCRVLFPYWRTFYPSGAGDKIFSGLDVALVDDLALAVWFMDDGSRTTSSVRFSVGPDPQNHKIQLKILRKFGLDVTLYDDPEDVSIHVKGRGSLTKFVDLVSPHIPACMSHKLELAVTRQAGPAPREVLLPEKLQPMIDRGMSAQGIASVFGVSRGSVSRALDRMGVARRPSGRPKASSFELTLEEATALISHLDPTFSGFVDEVTRVLLRTGIPLPNPTQEEIEHDAALLRKSPTHLDGTEFKSVSKAGSVVCSKHFPYRWDARYRDQPSVRQAWYDEKRIRQAIGFQIRVGDPVTPIRVFRAIQAVVRGPTNFRPSLAKAVVEAFSPVGGLVLDPCAGYGGRAAGTLASGRRYLGVDPNPKASPAFSGIARDLGGDLRFFNQPFEEFDELGQGADLVFTSPPYFSVERYSDDSTQSWVRYKTWGSWVRGFLKPFVERSWTHLKPDGYFCVNTKDIRSGQSVFPIGGELTRLALETGFSLEMTLVIPIGRIGKDLKTEPLFVFRRPS
jgi:DNA modification methylase